MGKIKQQYDVNFSLKCFPFRTWFWPIINFVSITFAVAAASWDLAEPLAAHAVVADAAAEIAAAAATVVAAATAADSSHHEIQSLSG